MEKWLFAHWIDSATIESSGTYTLNNHHIKAGEAYSENSVYLYKILIDGDTHHFLTIENRYFLPESEGGSFFNEEFPGKTLESGLVIFEVNKHLTTIDQIRRLMPPRVAGLPTQSEIGAFQPSDELVYTLDDFAVAISSISVPGEQISFNVTFGSALDHVEQLVALFADSSLLDVEDDT